MPRVRIPVIALAIVHLAGCSCSKPSASDDAGSDGDAEEECIPSPEVDDNELDEDCDGWLGTSQGFDVRAEHPRVLVSRVELDTALARMHGPEAREPWSGWFELVREAEDSGEEVDLPNLALLWHATGEDAYLESLVDRFPDEGDPGLDELLALDLVWDHVPVELKTSVMDRVHANPDVWYWNSINQSQEEDVSWGYHSAHGVSRALAYAGAFVLTPIEIGKDPETHPFDCLNYVNLVDEELSETGNFRRIENRVAGDPTHNDALAGTCGGMYDNFGYDSSEESFSVNVLAEFYFLTGQDRFTGFLHDECRGRYYQNMSYPHAGSSYETDQWCRRAGTESHILARIWNTQTDWIDQPRHDAVALTSWLYGDGRMQHYFREGRQRPLCGSPYDGMYWDLLFHDDDLEPVSPELDPAATYFSGPGLVSMRTDWSNDAAFGVLIAGEGISRRYEDAGSFLIHRRTDVFPHGGARIRNNPDNAKHHWYHIRSISKNTIKVFDPDECLSIDENSERGPLHTGPPLVDSDNMGGQMFEMSIAAEDLEYPTWFTEQPSRTSNPTHPLGLYETANIVRFEHVEGDWSYAAADATAAYTRKIDFFEREFLFLRPSTFVIFDRVRTADPSLRKVWVVHTVDEPASGCTLSDSDLGMRAWDDCSTIEIPDPENVTYLDALLPSSNRVEARGGDTVLGAGPLPLGPGDLIESDIPRWLEIFAVGPDTEGTITITGLSEEGTSEAIVFDGTEQVYVSSSPTREVTATALVDDTQSWRPGQWTDHMVHVSCGGSSEEARITGNDETTLHGTFSPCSAWGYRIYRPVANSYDHWTRIDSIASTDMDVDVLTVSVPHYFDAEDVTRRLHTFAPHTDGRDDGYRKRTDLGQYTLTIEATTPASLDNFLNVITLVDPPTPRPPATLVESADVAGVLLDARFVLFARDRQTLASLAVDLPDTPGLVFNLEPDTTYYHHHDGTTLHVDDVDNGGAPSTSSPMGVLAIP